MVRWLPAVLLLNVGCVDGWITRKDKKKRSNLLEDVGYCTSDLT
jgi:hypothetical protein